jgi:hypothetical protein
MQRQQMHSSIIYAYNPLHSFYMFRLYDLEIFWEMTPKFGEIIEHKHVGAI